MRKKQSTLASSEATGRSPAISYSDEFKRDVVRLVVVRLASEEQYSFSAADGGLLKVEHQVMPSSAHRLQPECALAAGDGPRRAPSGAAITSTLFTQAQP